MDSEGSFRHGEKPQMRRGARSIVSRSISPRVVLSPSTDLATNAFASCARGAIREAMLQIVMHAGRKSAIDGYTRRQPYSPKAHWIFYPSSKIETFLGVNF